MRLRSTVLVVLALVLGILLAASSALAAARVEFVVSASAADRANLGDVLADAASSTGASPSFEQVERIELSEVLSRENGSPDALSRIWVELRDERLDLYVTDRRQGRVFVRRLQARGRSLPVRLEELRQVVQAALEALTDGVQIGISLENARGELAPDPWPESAWTDTNEEPAPTADEALTVTGALRYELFGYSSELPVRHAFGAATALEFPVAFLKLGASAVTLFSPAKLESDPVGARFDAAQFRFLAHLAWPRGKPLQLTFGAGGGFDAIFVAPEAQDSEASLMAGDTLFDGMLRAQVGGRLTRGHLQFELALAADIALVESSYVVDVGGEPIPVLQPWPVRPGLLLQVGLK